MNRRDEAETTALLLFLGKEEEVDEIVDKDGNIARGKRPTNLDATNVTSNSTTDDAEKASHPQQGYTGIKVANYVRYAIEEELTKEKLIEIAMQKALGADEILHDEDMDYEKATDELEDLGVTDPVENSYNRFFVEDDFIKTFNDYIKQFNNDVLTKQIKVFESSLKGIEDLTGGNNIIGTTTNKTTDTLEAYAIDQLELRAGTYYRIKSLFDRSVSFTDIDLKKEGLFAKDRAGVSALNANDILNNPLFYNFNVEAEDICDPMSKVKPDKNSTDSTRYKDMFDYAMVVDRGNNPYGTKVLANLPGLNQILGNSLKDVNETKKLTSASMWSVLSKIASDHEFLLLPLTSYVNLNGAVVSGSTDPYALSHEMFGVYNNLDIWESNPAFVFQLGSITSNISNGDKTKKNSLSEFDLTNTFCLDIDQNALDVSGSGKQLNEGVPDDILKSNVTSFIVDFANKNQNMFKNIQLNTDEFTNTEESILTQVGLVSSGQPVLSSGKLFSAMENRSYSCTVTSLGNMTIQPLSYFYLKNVPLFYGTYWITNVSHKITPNNITTTFKGTRQPIARKPTANVSVIQAIFKIVRELTQAASGTNRSKLIPFDTSKTVYVQRDGNSDQQYGVVFQERNDAAGKYVSYDSKYVVGAYISKLCRYSFGGYNKIMAKTLLAYLYNNAATLCGDKEPSQAAKFMVDFVVDDMYNKFGTTDMSLSNLISAEFGTDDAPSSENEYISLLNEFVGTELGKLLDFLNVENESDIKIYQTFISDENGAPVKNDALMSKTVFGDEILTAM